MVSKYSLLGVSITTSTKKIILSFCSSVFSKRSKHIRMFPITIVTPNAEQIVLASHNENFRLILNSADIALPDGVGVVWGIRQLSVINRQAPDDVKPVSRHQIAVSRISGVDFMVDLCGVASEKNQRVLLYGGRGGIAGKALEHLQKQYPRLQGMAQDGMEFSGSDTFIDKTMIDSLVQTIRSRNIRIMFIGLGAPKQEYLLSLLEKRLQGEPVILMAVGGAFDMIAGKIIRAPKIVQNLGFEWLWRLIQEPWRWKRQRALMTFLRMVILKKFF